MLMQSKSVRYISEGYRDSGASGKLRNLIRNLRYYDANPHSYL